MHTASTNNLICLSALQENYDDMANVKDEQQNEFFTQTKQRMEPFKDKVGGWAGGRVGVQVAAGRPAGPCLQACRICLPFPPATPAGRPFPALHPL